MIDIFGDSRHLAVNTLGHAAGVLIFGIFLALVFSQRTFQQLRASKLSLDCGSACDELESGVADRSPDRSPQMASCSVSSPEPDFVRLVFFLPFSWISAWRIRFPIIVRSGYVLSFCAALAHLIEFFYDPAGFHQIGLAIITVGFGLLTVASVLMVLWSSEENPRSLSMRISARCPFFCLQSRWSISAMARALTRGQQNWSSITAAFPSRFL